MHYFPALTLDQIYYEISWQNLMMYLATIPGYESKKAEDKKEKIETITVEELFNSQNR